MLAKVCGINPKGPYLSLEQENCCVVFTHSIKRAREIGKFHVAVVQQRLRNVQKSVGFCCSPSPLQKLPIGCCDPEIWLPW